MISHFGKTIGHILFRAFCYVVRACSIAGFCFLFVSNTYRNQSVSTIKHMHLILGRVISKTQKKVGLSKTTQLSAQHQD